MEKKKSNTIKLGLFVIIGTLIFTVGIYFIGKQKNLFNSTVSIKATFDDVNGLQKGNNVRFSGINVGTVRAINMINDSSIQVDMVIEAEILQHIKKNATATIGSDGLVGNVIVNILPSEGTAPSMQEGDALQTNKKIKTEDLLKTLSQTNENAAILTANLLLITDKIIKGNGTIGVLLNDERMGKNIQASLKYLEETTHSATESMAKLSKLISSLDNKKNFIGLMNDTLLVAEVKQIVHNLESTSENLKKTVDNINQTVVNAKDGKGALNYLSNDPSLVKKINSILSNANQSTLLLNQNLEALKHNVFFRGYFRKQEKLKADPPK